MSIYLVRHGQTDGNRDRIVQTPQTPLSALGLEQAQQLADSCDDLPVSLIICSDYVRTQQTAAPLHNNLGCELVLSELFRERSFGDLRGKHYDEIDQNFFDHSYHPPNGESHQQFAQRVKQAWGSVLSLVANLAVDKSILIMTHGLVLREILTTHLKVDPTELEIADFANTCVTQVDTADKKTVIKLCDSSHLKQKAVSQGAV